MKLFNRKSKFERFLDTANDSLEKLAWMINAENRKA